MKLRATYAIDGVNPFIPDINAFARQFQYAEAEVPDDSDMIEMENFARDMTPEGFHFVRLEKIEPVKK